MSRATVSTLTVLLALVWTAPARAQEGNGLYAPFPSVGAGEQADGYYAQLGLQVGPRELRRGVFARGFSSASGPAAPSRRAGVAAVGVGLPALLAALLAAGLLALAVRRTRLPTAA